MSAGLGCSAELQPLRQAFVVLGLRSLPTGLPAHRVKNELRTLKGILVLRSASNLWAQLEFSFS